MECIGGDYVEAPVVIDETWAIEHYKDPALAEAITLMRRQRELGQWPQLDEDEDPAYISNLVQLETLLEQREAFEKGMTEIQDKINNLEGLEIRADRGLGLPEEVNLEEPVIAIYDAQGNLVGRWKVGANDDLSRSLAAVEMVRLDQAPPEEDSTEH
jgi:hypothetical protein